MQYLEEFEMYLKEQIKSLENGKGIQYLINSAKEVLNNPILIHDMNFNLLAHTSCTIDDIIWNEVISTGAYSQKTQEFFAKESLMERLANTEKSSIIIYGNLKYARMAGYIYNRDNIKVAVVVMYECNTPFDEEVRAVFELLAEKISNEIRNDEHFVSYGMALHKDMIHKLLDGVITDPVVYTSQMQVLYDGFMDYIYVAVIDVTLSNNKNNLESLIGILKDEYLSFKYAFYSNYIVMIMSSKYDHFNKDLFFEKHIDLFKQNDLFVGVSSSFENLYELRKNYDMAVNALKNGIEKNNEQQIFFS
jgi:hypothetical protein